MEIVMKKTHITFLIVLFISFLILTSFIKFYPEPDQDDLIGAWKGTVQFNTGVFKDIQDLEFMRVFNSGGTMTESSNYDGAPPVPPAYGIWRKTGDLQYEAKYEFYTTYFPDSFHEMADASGFSPAGHGLIYETITLSGDGKVFSSKITLTLYDDAGMKISSDAADASAKKMTF
jgi:hypothetical protein